MVIKFNKKFIISSERKDTITHRKTDDLLMAIYLLTSILANPDLIYIMINID